jgi:hypothetical protein
MNVIDRLLSLKKFNKMQGESTLYRPPLRCHIILFLRDVLE